jgi:TPR repeat protein
MHFPSEELLCDMELIKDTMSKRNIALLAVHQFNMGISYDNGIFQPKDLKKAFEYYLLSVKNGAQNSVASCFFKGDGTDQSLGFAQQWYSKAADQGHEKAKHMLNVLENCTHIYTFF